MQNTFLQQEKLTPEFCISVMQPEFCISVMQPYLRLYYLQLIVNLHNGSLQECHVFVIAS